MPCNYREYHPKWNLISFLIRVRRANNKCEWCGAANYQPHPVTGNKETLTVAHIDHDKDHNRFSNLAALCNRCHLNHDREQHIAKARANRKLKSPQLHFSFDDIGKVDFNQRVDLQLLHKVN